MLLRFSTFIGQNKCDSIEPILFLDGVISNGFHIRDITISPDGNEIYYTLLAPNGTFSAILYIQKKDKKSWTIPKVASFSGEYMDMEPSFSPNGKRIYYSSKRPVDKNHQKEDFDIWFVEKNNNEWGQPVHLEYPINTQGNEFYPIITENGNLYYTATYFSGYGKEDIVKADWDGKKYLPPVSLDSNINSDLYEFNAYVSPDEKIIIYSSFGRNDKGKGDLYISLKDETGKWTKSINLISVNSSSLDYSPFLSWDKQTLYFTSERNILYSNYSKKKITYYEMKRWYSSPGNGNGHIYFVNFKNLLLELKIKSN